MDPKRAADALKVLKPRLAVPIHWGTLWPIGMGRVAPHRLETPPLEFEGFAAERAPDVQVLVAAPGTTIPIPR